MVHVELNLNTSVDFIDATRIQIRICLGLLSILAGETMKFPEFICIGSMKCGTTPLWHNCNAHPQITMGKNPQDPKKTSTEIRFWNNGQPYHTWRRGLKWYKGLFDGEMCGEKCANYIEHPSALRRMKEQHPGVKLVWCVREPVARILSEFWMHHFKPEKISKFSKFCRGSPIKRGEYIKQVERSVLPVFSKEQLYVIVQERMIADTAGEMNKLFAWLGLPPYTTVVKRAKWKDRANMGGNGYRRWKTAHGVDMATETRAKLNRHYWPLNERLFDFLGERIPEWE